MGKPKKTPPTPNPDYEGFTPFTETFMHDLGYVHESVIEEASSTTPRSRARWNDLQGVMFGNERWYFIDDIKSLLADKIAAKRGHELHVKDQTDADAFVGVV
jgi:hypothetical protein